jgi:hypothetical protein
MSPLYRYISKDVEDFAAHILKFFSKPVPLVPSEIGDYCTFDKRTHYIVSSVLNNALATGIIVDRELRDILNRLTTPDKTYLLDLRSTNQEDQKILKGDESAYSLMQIMKNSPVRIDHFKDVEELLYALLKVYDMLLELFRK